VSDDTSARYMPDGWVLPAVDDLNEEFFTSGELRLERCPECGHVQHPPSGVCTACQHVGCEHVTVEPRGVIESWTVVHHAVHPMLQGRVPYNVVVVALGDHPHVRIVGNLVDAGDEEIRIGAPVRATWTPPIPEDAARGVRLLQWRRDG
jgi:uncharacterized OB-fold protein